MLRKAPKPTLPTTPVEYPSGVFIHTEKGYFYIHGEGKRMRCISKRVLDSWSPQRVIETTEAAVVKYKITSKIRFRNGSLIWNLSDGRIYLIENGMRRHVVSPDAFTRIGVDYKNLGKHVMYVSLDEVQIHPEGAPLN